MVVNIMNIIIVSHNNLAIELKSVINSVYGKIDNLYAITFQDHESVADLTCKINNLVKDSTKSNLILIDFASGSPYNSIYPFLSYENVNIITGVNVPMLLSIVTNQNKPMNEIIDIAIKNGQNGICDIKKLINEKLNNYNARYSNEDTI